AGVVVLVPVLAAALAATAAGATLAAAPLGEERGPAGRRDRAGHGWHSRGPGLGRPGGARRPPRPARRPRLRRLATRGAAPGRQPGGVGDDAGGRGLDPGPSAAVHGTRHALGGPGGAGHRPVVAPGAGAATGDPGAGLVP